MTQPEKFALECGRDPIAVVDRARVGRSDDHEGSCVFCQAAIRAAAVSQDAAREVAADTFTVPPGLLPTVMRTVWAELRRPTDIPISSATGSAFITDLAVGSLLEAALNELPELLVHSCTVDYVEAGSGELSVTVSAAGAYRADLQELGESARNLVVEVIRRQLGATVSTADIEIVDVFDSQGAS